MLTIVDPNLQSHISQVLEYQTFGGKRSFAEENVVALLLFEEPSTRTRFSTESAAKRLGINTVYCDSLASTSMQKGESLSETANILANYFDIFAIRSRWAGFPRLFSRLSQRPVLNLGDGSNEHPSQALATMVSVKKKFGGFDNLHIVIWGDLELGRVAHSVFLAAIQLGLSVTLIPVGGYYMPEGYIQLARLLRPECDIAVVPNISCVEREIDVLYILREQIERRDGFRSPEYRALTVDDLERSTMVLHPLPHGSELDKDGWRVVSGELLAHVRTTYTTRQWLIGTTVDNLIVKGRLQDTLAAFTCAGICQNPTCATALAPEMASWLSLGNRHWCEYCLSGLD